MSFTASACAQTRGIPDPAGCPLNRPCAGKSSRSQTCSGSIPPGLCLPPQDLEKPLGFGLVSQGQLIMRPLTGQQRPSSADSDPSKRPAVPGFPITVVRVAMPDRPGLRFRLQCRVHHFDRVPNARIIRGSQAIAYQGQRVRADDLGSRELVLSRRSVLQCDTLRDRGRR